MPIRLNITIDDDLHQFLKRELEAEGSTGSSTPRFERGCSGRGKRSIEAYKAAAPEPWPTGETREIYSG